jgi:lipase chaperone LimK
MMVLAVLVGASWLFGRSSARSPTVTEPTKSPQFPPAFVPAMRGTQPDGQLTVHEDTLQPDRELLYLFDYYLSAQPQKTMPEIASAIRAELRVRLRASPIAIEQAQRLLEQYLGYKKALLALEQAESTPADGGSSLSARLRARGWRLQQIRAQYFSESEAAAFFGLDELRDQDAIRRLEIFEDPRLNHAEKLARYAQLDATLPSQLKQDREAPQRIQGVERRVWERRTAGASEHEIYQYRAAQFSADAAYRLQQLDQEEHLWASRIQAYQAQARQLLRLPEGPFQIPAVLTLAQQHALQALRDRNFKPEEQKRLVAYEAGESR